MLCQDAHVVAVKVGLKWTKKKDNGEHFIYQDIDRSLGQFFLFRYAYIVIYVIL